MRGAVPARKLLEDAREAALKGRSLLRAENARPLATQPGILDAYDSLCRMLDGIDPGRLDGAIQSVSQQVERLRELSDDVGRLQRLRETMRDL